MDSGSVVIHVATVIYIPSTIAALANADVANTSNTPAPTEAMD